jgi:hypothetical protein
MFGALAASYEAMTSNDMNCFTVKDNESNNRYCNVAVQASVFAEGESLHALHSSASTDKCFRQSHLHVSFF